jgi:hypothetical protein
VVYTNSIELNYRGNMTRVGSVVVFMVGNYLRCFSQVTQRQRIGHNPVFPGNMFIHWDSGKFL